jgi:FkbM family methyltransferase
MLNSMLDFYQTLFGRKFFYKFNQLLYVLSLRGLGILNYKNDRQSGEANFIKHQVSNIKNGVIFDVGANVGAYSKFVKKLNQHIEIFAFEPHPTTYQRLVDNVETYGVNTYNVGVGSSEGMLKLYDYADDDGSEHASLYKDVIEEIHNGQSVCHEVRIISLDAFAIEHKINRVNLLKIDTEGHELEVLKGFGTYIKANKIDMIHFEFNEMNIASRVSFKDFWDMLPNYNFFRMLPDGLVAMEKYSPIFCEIYAYQNIVAKLKVEFSES